MAKLPMAEAKCSGVRKSWELTVQLTSSGVAWAKITRIAFKSVLKAKINIIIVGNTFHLRWIPLVPERIDRVLIYLQIASTNCWSIGWLELILCKNSLFSYFARIHRSFSSLPTEGFGFNCPPVFFSQMEFAIALPIDSIRLRGPGLKSDNQFL